MKIIGKYHSDGLLKSCLHILETRSALRGHICANARYGANVHCELTYSLPADVLSRGFVIQKPVPSHF